MKTDIKIILPGDKPLNIDLSQEDLNWELEEIDEREMGVERLYEAVLVKDVEDLDEPLEITLRVWEYPEGFANMQEIELSDESILWTGMYPSLSDMTSSQLGGKVTVKAVSDNKITLAFDGLKFYRGVSNGAKELTVNGSVTYTKDEYIVE